MITVMASCLLLLLLLSACRLSASMEEYEHESGTCNNTYHLFKNTMASSDSKRDCANAYKIFPDIHDEGATKFHDGECAYQCKLELADTCFKVHAPQTWQHDEGILPIHTYEKKLRLKWQYVLSDQWAYDYDAFLDFNMAFWVQSLDDYLLHWQSSDDITLEYLGIEWSPDYHLTIDDAEFTANNIFYSILVHSPSSAINYEFISFKRPRQHLYDSMKWIQSALPRCTFKAQQPWTRQDHANIVPVRLSRAATNIDAVYDFYVNIMEATVVHYSKSETAMERNSKINMKTQTMFFLLKDTKIELQFVQRPDHYTTPDFTLLDYERMLLETHQTIVTSPYCGNDRWFDNHFAYSTWTVPGLLDRVLLRLNEKGIVYRATKAPYEHSSVYAKQNLDAYGVDSGYSLSIVDPTGHTLDVGGYINDLNVQRFAPVSNPQWCYEPCPGGLMEGHIDESRKYVDSDDENYIAPDNVDAMVVADLNSNVVDYRYHEWWMHFVAVMAVPVVVCVWLIVHFGCEHKRISPQQECSPLLQQV